MILQCSQSILCKRGVINIAALAVSLPVLLLIAVAAYDVSRLPVAKHQLVSEAGNALHSLETSLLRIREREFSAMMNCIGPSMPSECCDPERKFILLSKDKIQRAVDDEADRLFSLLGSGVLSRKAEDLVILVAIQETSPIAETARVMRTNKIEAVRPRRLDDGPHQGLSELRQSHLVKRNAVLAQNLSFNLGAESIGLPFMEVAIALKVKFVFGLSGSLFEGTSSDSHWITFSHFQALPFLPPNICGQKQTAN